MSLENIGECDNFVWQFDRKTQDEYYPFMDRLHTIMNIKRVEYGNGDLKSFEKMNFPQLSAKQRLTLSMVVSKKGKLYTLDDKLLGLCLDFVEAVRVCNHEMKFPAYLENYYKKSLKLRIIQTSHSISSLAAPASSRR